MKTFRCKQCGYEWRSKKKDGPKACPRCKSYTWKAWRRADDKKD